MVLMGKSRTIGRPMIKCLSKGPHALESELWERLSPMTKKWVASNVVVAMLSVEA